MIDDVQVIQAALSGDQKAFTLLYNTYKSTVRYYLNRKASFKASSEDIEDVLQDTFTKAFIHLKYFNISKGKFVTWLIRIAINTCIDVISRQHKSDALKRKIDNPLQEYYLYEDPTIPIDVQLLSEEYVRHVSKVLRFLPYKYQCILLLRIEGYQYEEIAQVLDMPLGTVKGSIFRAHEILNKKYNNAKEN